MILIHGAGGNRLYWPPEIRRWRGAIVYAVDLPGHGDSGGHSEATLSSYAEQMMDWMREMKLPLSVVAGHSMGGAIALTMALRSTRQLAGLALIGSSARLRVAPTILQNSAERSTFAQAVDQVIEAAFSPEAERGLVRLARQRMLEAGHRTFHNDFQACDHFDIRSRLQEIDIPAIVITGEHDRLTPPHLGQELAEGLPEASFHEVEAAGHMVMLERPHQVLDLIKVFYQTHFNSAG
ncbi:MAG: alpha/beta hydrolase [Anaerolineales bacterium]